MTRAFDDRQIRLYLLGDLSEAEESGLEAAFFGDPDLLARVELARTDLADDYAAGRLSDSEREKFERRILAVEDGPTLVAISRALQSASAASPEAPRRAGWRIDRQWLALAAMIPVAIAVFAVWRNVSVPGRSKERPQVSSLATAQPRPPAAIAAAPARTGVSEAQGATPAPPASSPARPIVATLMLTADLERSQGLPPTLRLSSGATHVVLVVPPGSPAAAATRARVESVEGAPVWSGSIAAAGVDAAGARPRIRIPVASLPPGDYLVSIGTASEMETAGLPRYYFRVRAR